MVVRVRPWLSEVRQMLQVKLELETKSVIAEVSSVEKLVLSLLSSVIRKAAETGSASAAMFPELSKRSAALGISGINFFGCCFFFAMSL